MDNNKIYIDRLFPDVNEKKLQHKLKIDHESIMYITIPEDAKKITRIIQNHINKYIKNHETIITDATGGIGGNVISFANSFKHVNVIELESKRFNYLLNNIDAYNLKNVTLEHDDSVVAVPKIENHHVIFIDPPWGGKKFKDKDKWKDKIRLQLSSIPIEDICVNYLDKNKMKCVPKLIVLKLPKNYDIQLLYNAINNNNNMFNIYKYELHKMLIIVIEGKN